jgi:hypothetical protein
MNTLTPYILQTRFAFAMNGEDARRISVAARLMVNAAKPTTNQRTGCRINGKDEECRSHLYSVREEVKGGIFHRLVRLVAWPGALLPRCIGRVYDAFLAGSTGLRKIWDTLHSL